MKTCGQELSCWWLQVFHSTIESLSLSSPSSLLTLSIHLLLYLSPSFSLTHSLTPSYLFLSFSLSLSHSLLPTFCSLFLSLTPSYLLLYLSPSLSLLSLLIFLSYLLISSLSFSLSLSKYFLLLSDSLPYLSLSPSHPFFAEFEDQVKSSWWIMGSSHAKVCFVRLLQNWNLIELFPFAKFLSYTSGHKNRPTDIHFFTFLYQSVFINYLWVIL